MVEFIYWNCYGGVGFVFKLYKEINMADIPDDLPDETISIKEKIRQHDAEARAEARAKKLMYDLFIVNVYNFFAFALGLGLGFLLWGMQ